MIYPKFYYQRGKESDRDWILSRMSYIPESQKEMVSEKYEELFLSGRGGRKEANTYLQGVATEFRVSKCQ